MPKPVPRRLGPLPSVPLVSERHQLSHGGPPVNPPGDSGPKLAGAAGSANERMLAATMLGYVSGVSGHGYNPYHYMQAEACAEAKKKIDEAYYKRFPKQTRR